MHKLHGYFKAVAQKQFAETLTRYDDAMEKIGKVNNGLKQAKDDMDRILKSIEELGKLGGAVEKLLFAAANVIAQPTSVVLSTLVAHASKHISRGKVLLKQYRIS